MSTQLFNVCTDKDKKDVMTKALDNRRDYLIRTLGSQKVLERVKWLKKEIENMPTC